MPQTSQSAEYLAAFYAAMCAAAPALLHDDCANVVRDVEKAREGWLKDKGAYASVLRNIRRVDPEANLAIIKVKAHVRDKEVVEKLTPWQEWATTGNDHADRLCGEEEKRHPQPSEETRRRVEKDMEDVMATLKVMAEVLPLWPYDNVKHARKKKPGRGGAKGG